MYNMYLIFQILSIFFGGCYTWICLEGPPKIRPHRRCWGVIVRMALVKGYRFTLGGGPLFGQNLLFLIGRDARLQKTL